MTHSDLFVVRIWHQIAGGFRASVRKVDEEETRHFWAPDQVTSFLATAARAQEPESGDTTPSDPPPTAR